MVKSADAVDATIAAFAAIAVATNKIAGFEPGHPGTDLYLWPSDMILQSIPADEVVQRGNCNAALRRLL